MINQSLITDHSQRFLSCWNTSFIIDKYWYLWYDDVNVLVPFIAVVAFCSNRMGLLMIPFSFKQPTSIYFPPMSLPCTNIVFSNNERCLHSSSICYMDNRQQEKSNMVRIVYTMYSKANKSNKWLSSHPFLTTNEEGTTPYLCPT